MMRAVFLLLLFCTAMPLVAQQRMHLAELQEAALARDPRSVQYDLQADAARLRQRNLEASWLPTLVAGGEATYQSEVTGFPLSLPGISLPLPPRERYGLTLDAEQLLYDGGLHRARRAAEEARLALDRAQLVVTRHPLRIEVSEAFFRALLLEAQVAEADVYLSDLEARLAQVRAQAHEGVALAGDVAAIEAGLLRATQSRDEADAGRRAALAVLSDLTGRQIADADDLVVPDLSTPVARLRSELGSGQVPRSHPQFAVLAARDETLARQVALIDAGRGVRVAAFGQAGVGRPGYEQFRHDAHGYWMAGIRLRWQPWDWRMSARERREVALQRHALAAEEEALALRLRWQIQDVLAAMDRLEAALVLDEQIVALLEQTEQQARTQLDERAITPAAYVTARADLQSARLARNRHRVSLEQARSHLLNMLGVSP